jgi:excisionase family DNA binding protein
MIQIEGMITVAEAAQRLKRSTEQVRRYLREGKLKGQRVGNQWFVEEAGLKTESQHLRPLIPPELTERIRRTRDEIHKRGVTFDVVEMIREHRESPDR